MNTPSAGAVDFEKAWPALEPLYRQGPATTPKEMARLFFLMGYRGGMDFMARRLTPQIRTVSELPLDAGQQ